MARKKEIKRSGRKGTDNSQPLLTPRMFILLALAIALLSFGSWWLRESLKQKDIDSEIAAMTTRDKANRLVEHLSETQNEKLFNSLLTLFMRQFERADFFTETDYKFLLQETKRVHTLEVQLDLWVCIAHVAEKLLYPLETVMSYHEQYLKIEPDKTCQQAIFTYDRLSRLLTDEIKLPSEWDTTFKQNLAMEKMKEAIQNRGTKENSNRYYGVIIQCLMFQRRTDEVLRVTSECIEDLSNSPYIPFHCYHQRATTLVWLGRIHEAVSTFRIYYELLIEKTWKLENGGNCTAVHIPVSLEHFDHSQYSQYYKREEITYPPPLPHPCSNQQWPNAVKYDNSQNRYLKYQVQGKFERMQCFEENEKRPYIYTIAHTVIKGPGKLISQEFPLEDGSSYQCNVYSFGFVYQNGNSAPRIKGFTSYSYFDLPIRHYKKLLVLPFLESNYYHFMIETLPQILIALHYTPLETDPDLFILLTESPSSFTIELLKNVGYYPSKVITYEPSKYRYYAEVAYIVDWGWVDTPVPNIADAQFIRHPEDYYVPPLSVVHINSIITSLIADQFSAASSDPRPKVVYLHRSTQPRAILNGDALGKLLLEICESFGVQFLIHQAKADGSFGSVSAQLHLFKEALVVIGSHGAGLSNVISCKPGTSLVELPADPEKVSVYSRLASALRLDYWVVPSVQIFAFGDVYLTDSMLADISETLRFILSEKGFSSNK